MQKPNWIEHTKMNIKGIIDIKKAALAWKKENKNDSLLLKDLNRELKKFHVKLRLEQYENSPFSSTASDVMPIIFKYVDMCEQKYNKVHLLSTLRSPRFHNAIPYLINFYKKELEKYDTPKDEYVLLSVCETIERIGSDGYIDQYIDLLKNPITPSAECIIKLLTEMPISQEIESCILSLVEKENLIPKSWIGTPNETDKYWCSQIALGYIANRRQSKYNSYLEYFLSPQDLSWIYFAESEFCQYNYSECYKQYTLIAKHGLKK